MQSVEAELGLGELELVGQSVHTALPVVDLYFPVTHAEHVPPFAPVYPTMHVQAATAELGLGELEFVGHVKQVPMCVAANVAEYVPVAQFVQATKDVAPV